MKFVLLTNLKLLLIANSFLPDIAEHEIFSASKYENANYCLSWTEELSWAWKKFYNLGSRSVIASRSVVSQIP